MTRCLSIYLVLSLIASAEGLCQKVKIATVDLEYIYANLPAHQKLMAEIDSSSSKYQAVQKEKLTAYQQKLQAYQNLGKQTPEPVLKDKAAELESIQAAMQEFQTNAEKDLRTRYAARFPEIEKIVRTAIAECAKQQQVTYVARNQADYNAGESTPFLLYSSEPDTDLTDHVLSKLGVNTHPNKGKPRQNGVYVK
ncbi:Skp family chaperone for outer membrane proteins [Dyadobacter sp. BE34]|uniref:Skp family chaperone for outer membrane proteins n=1 Tax=Dyadobacter fermentans TaxID=94254 RepID=A0ABU1R0D6_9BACT|nr:MULTISPECIES: OmpH family outer membrane protein [Dyadobacter]MDR6806876.1 Skp family chaperone for outer membrane proteins [Dyadobacter fermentans]MDR7044618.1 Skp family chaperone for outer membrane proteins [Dyadobacter sp. BE242]MDR7198928.1 Skp family chaperone for outer membrane proteins [Dyadobacter sp. BE34]MDR7216890.1 Skp family chaperone for outer membrane proteins [Dyadobacter sp. BE31]MDR7263584.1 Skp family chaperone for outer membrane proteins [Dyadobacter sp. BE32]